MWQRDFTSRFCSTSLLQDCKFRKCLKLGNATSKQDVTATETPGCDYWSSTDVQVADTQYWRCHDCNQTPGCDYSCLADVHVAHRWNWRSSGLFAMQHENTFPPILQQVLIAIESKIYETLNRVSTGTLSLKFLAFSLHSRKFLFLATLKNPCFFLTFSLPRTH